MSYATMRRTVTAHFSTIVTGSLATLAIAGTVLLTELRPAWAQHALIARTSDGPDGAESSQMFVMPAFPNRFEALLRPEFSRRDMQLIHEQLRLDESQMYVVEVLMDSYTEQFQAAVKDFRSVQKRFRLQIPGMEGEMFGGRMLEGFDPLHDIMHVSEGGEDGQDVLELGDMTFVMESPGSVQIGISQTIDSDVRVTDAGAEPQIAVSFVAEDENGESVLTDEQLKDITERISAQIKERLEQVEAKRAELLAQREAAEAARAENPDAVVEEEPLATAEEVADAGRKLIVERRRLRDELVGDVKLLLNDEQKELWPPFERVQRRVSTMHFGEFSGERVDVIGILKEQEPAASNAAALAAAREQYAIALDEALKQRNELLPEHEIEMLLFTDAMFRSESFDEEERLDLMDRVGDARAAVRDVNLNAAETIEPLLAEDDRDEFRDAVLRQAYPQLYSEGSTQRALAAAPQLEGIDDETRHAIEVLSADYNAQLAALNDRIAAQIRQDEPRQHRRMFEVMDEVHELEAQRGAGAEVDFKDLGADPSDKLMSERRSLNKRTMDQLRGMLTEEQVAQLPKTRRHMPMFFDSNGPPPPPPQGVRVIRTERKTGAE